MQVSSWISKHSISFATNLAVNFGCNRFRFIPEIVFNLLRTTSWSGWLYGPSLYESWNWCSGSLKLYTKVCISFDATRVSGQWGKFICFFHRDYILNIMISRLSRISLGIITYGRREENQNSHIWVFFLFIKQTWLLGSLTLGKDHLLFSGKVLPFVF